LPSTIFEKIGNVYNISIEIDSNNKKFNALPNPSSAHYPNHPDKVFLTDLNIHQTSLSCDCEIGWVEFWQRKKRQYFCSHQDWTDDEGIKSQMDFDDDCDDYYPDDDLRSARCSNKNGEPLLEVLKTELECGWSGSSQLTTQNIVLLVTFMITFVSLIL
jgi:hypothetical protein